MKKAMMFLLSVLSFSLVFFNQAAAIADDDEKYHFDDLEQIDDFLYWQARSWQVIDSRSLIIRISPAQSYLLILDQNIWALRYTEEISISSRNSRVRTNVDLVSVPNQAARRGRIEAIYLLPDRESRQHVYEQIRGIESEDLNAPRSDLIIDDRVI